MTYKHSVQFFTALFLVLLCILACSSVSAEQAHRKITVMVYMCGSNLESSYGSASKDIDEMLKAKTDPKETGLLIMTGGSNTNAGDFSTSSARILEIGAGRKRSVCEFESMNMGEQNTLARFIRYCVENRPAEQYALILWDHGGGPLEGVCWDETHNMDNLSLSELTGALDDADLEKKLSWIGFDACLMSSLEVAGQLEPYAEYMIASQETEPDFGWDYSFLTDIGKDSNGAETGRRIVDSFFSGHENYRSVLTMACTKLSAIPDVINALDPIFRPLSKRLDKEHFQTLSGIRMSTAGFGRAAPEMPATGYDLVDVRDLVSRMGDTDNTKDFLDLLDQAVVYNRSNQENTGGLTLYHPYFNKINYIDKWKNNYLNLPFSKGYQSYLDSFGSMLTGEILFRWLDLIPHPVQVHDDGSYYVEMPMTEEQAENAVAAQLLIIRDTLGNQLDKNCVLIASCNAEIGDDHIVRANWNGKAIYAESSSSKVGPISYTLTDDGKTNTILGYYILNGDYHLNGQIVLFEVDASDDSEYPEFSNIRVWDDATQSFTSRMSFTEEPYRVLEFWNNHRSFPGIDESQVLPPYEKWDNNRDTIVTSDLKLPDTWKLHSEPLKSGQQVYALFRILDSQQNAICSLPVEIPDSSLTVLKPIAGSVNEEHFKADMFCRINTSPSECGLQIEWTLQNPLDEKENFRLRDLVINNIRIIGEPLSGILLPDETSHETLTIGRNDLSLLNKLESISGTLEVTPAGKEMKEIPFCFTFSDNDIAVLSENAAVLSEAEQNGISMKLLSIEEDGNLGWNISFLAENRSTEEYSFGEVLLNGIRINGLITKPLPAGMERVYNVSEQNQFSSILLDMPGHDVDIEVVYLEENVLQNMGVQELNHITVLSNRSMAVQEAFEFPLKSPVPVVSHSRANHIELLIPEFYPPDNLPSPDESSLPVLAQNNLFSVRLRRLAVGKTKLSLLLEWTNNSDEWLCFQYDSPRINGHEANLSDNLTISPHSTYLSEALISGGILDDPDTDITELTFTVYDQNRELPGQESPIRLTFPEPIRMGKQGGIWFNGEQIDVATVHIKDADLMKEKDPKPLEETVLIPENLDAYRKIIDVPLPVGMEEQINFCRVAVLRKDTDDFWQIVTLNDVKPDGSGALHIPHPGLFPTVKGNAEINALTKLSTSDPDTIQGELGFGIKVFCKNGEAFDLRPVKWEMNRTSGTIMITEYEQDQTPYTRQWEMSGAAFCSYSIRITPKEDGTLPHIGECEHRSEWFDGVLPHEVLLENEPLQLQLRPITAEDDLYVMVSVFGTDERKWSLPIFPYPID